MKKNVISKKDITFIKKNDLIFFIINIIYQ